MTAPTQPQVAAWFDAVYRERGLRYLRPAEAYAVYLQLLSAQRGEALLDIGCGPGLLLEHGLRLGLHCSGVDLSAEAVAMAKQRLPEADVRIGNAEHLPFADASFDCITAIATLERVLDRGRALREMARVARPGARFCLMVRNASTPSWRLWKQALGRREVQGHQDAQTLEDRRELFAAHGFAIVDVLPDQWPRQRLRRLFGRRPAPGAEPIARGPMPLRLAPQFVFLLQRRRSAPAAGPQVQKLYETLSRWHWLGRTWRGSPAGEGLQMRKQLRPVADATTAFDDWLLGLAAPTTGAKVLDVGCGFGSTSLRWARAAEVSCTGVTDNPFQAARAREQARALHVDDRCRFVVQDYAAPLPGPCDVAVAVESLAHARDLDAAVQAIAEALAPGGRLLVVDDVREGTDALDGTVQELAGRWGTPRLPTAADFERAIARAGLVLIRRHDLSDRVPVNPAGRRAGRRRWLRALRMLVPLPAVRRLCEAFLGGLALEALYQRGHARYHVFEARSPESP